MIIQVLRVLPRYIDNSPPTDNNGFFGGGILQVQNQQWISWIIQQPQLQMLLVLI